VAADIATLLAALATAATAAGWTIVSTGTNSLTIYYPTGIVTLQSAYINGLAPLPTFPYQFPQLALFPKSAYQWGVVYRDGAGRTKGTVSSLSAQATTAASPGGDVSPFIEVNLNFVPPAWAIYYHLVRTDTLTYNKYLEWITSAAYANTIGQRQFAYFGIGN